MAQRVITQLIDDLDGGEATETVRFTIDNQDYEIDLSERHAQALRESFAEYTAVARKVSAGRRPRGRSSTPAASASDAKEIRAWANEQGIEVPERGRIPQDIKDKYYAAKG